MTTKMKVELGAVQETLLIPLLGRAAETKKKTGTPPRLRATAGAPSRQAREASADR